MLYELVSSQEFEENVKLSLSDAAAAEAVPGVHATVDATEVQG